jgi:hypothetical protein
MVSVERDAGMGGESDRYWTDRLLDFGFREEDVLLYCGCQLYSLVAVVQDTGAAADYSPIGSYFIIASFSPNLARVVV